MPIIPAVAPRPSPRVIVADDHDWTRRILVQIIGETLPSADICATEDGVRALEAYRQGGAGFVITNHQTPNMDGIALIRGLREQDTHLPILMVSMSLDIMPEALAAGASWFLTKEKVVEHLPALLRQFARAPR